MGIITFLILVGILFYLHSLSKRIERLEDAKQIAYSPVRGTSAVRSVAPKPTTPKAAMASQNKAVKSEPTFSSSMDSTSFINLLPKIGVVALVFGLAFFLKYAIDQGWVSVNLRLMIGASIGSLLLILFYLWREKYAKYAMVLAGGGLAVWYLTVFAAVHLYSVMTVNGGFAVLIIVTGIGLLLAYKTKSKALSAMSWGGAYLVPVILSVSEQSYSLLLVYLTIVTGSLLLTVFYNQARYLFVLALAGSALNLLAASFSASANQNFDLHTLLFLLVNIFMHTILLAFAIRKEDPSNLYANEREYALLFGLTYLLLGIPLAVLAYSEFRDLAAMIMVALGAWTFLTYAFIDRLEFVKVNYLVAGLGALILSTAIYWQFDVSLQVVMLYVLGMIGLIVGQIQHRAELRVWGLVVILFGIVSTLLVHYTYSFPTFLVNEKFGLEMLGLASLLVAHYIFPKESLTEFENNVHDAIQYIIAVLLWLFVSWDLANYYGLYDQENQRNLALSLWWIVYAVILVAISAAVRLKSLRRIGFLLFGLVILKVFLYDLQSLETVYRIISFISLGVILLIVSFVYQKNKEQIKDYLEL